ncbi:hypothetical protein V6N13_146593 [Hibiscus sabdariffa]|uniref:Uncharacterized protein n=1 Tax=Hibiscus sabdariffa TaxID=183260 RepID=A0ABR2TTW2_9ROSI
MQHVRPFGEEDKGMSWAGVIFVHSSARARLYVSNNAGLGWAQFPKRACLKKHVGSNAFPIILLAVESKVKSTVSTSTLKDKDRRTGGRQRLCLFLFFRGPGLTRMPCPLDKYVYKIDT